MAFKFVFVQLINVLEQMLRSVLRLERTIPDPHTTKPPVAETFHKQQDRTPHNPKTQRSRCSRRGRWVLEFPLVCLDLYSNA